MNARRTIACVVGLLGVTLSYGAATSAQAPGTASPVVTEARRREIVRTAQGLTAETLADVQRRAEAGDVEAQVVAGMALLEGRRVPKDVDSATRWIRAAADAGHPIGQNALGNLYIAGRGVLRDAGKAVECYRKAVAQGYAQAQNNLGWAHLEGVGVAANPAEGVRLFRLAAEQGNADGLYALAYAYRAGTGVEKNAAEATAWCRRAAEQGQVNAQYDMGAAYKNGEGVHRDRAEAERWFQQASDQGDAAAAFQVGVINLEKAPPGRLDPVGTEVAIESFRLSAGRGYPLAAFALGELFTGRLAKYHVREDELVACQWYLVASTLDKQGDWERQWPTQIAAIRKDLPGRLGKVRKHLQSAQWAECQRRVSDWTTAHQER